MPLFSLHQETTGAGISFIKTSGMSAAASLQQDAALHNTAALATLCLFFFFYFSCVRAAISALRGAIVTLQQLQQRGLGGWVRGGIKTETHKHTRRRARTHTQHRRAASTYSSQ